jgi:hypothetical protein
MGGCEKALQQQLHDLENIFRKQLLFSFGKKTKVDKRSLQRSSTKVTLKGKTVYFSFPSLRFCTLVSPKAHLFPVRSFFYASHASVEAESFLGWGKICF